MTLNPDPTPLPSVSLIVPACNEAQTIEPALRSLLAMNYPALELIVVNDRSTDGTGEILKRLRLEFAQLKVIEVHILPDGWLGKVHALSVGAAVATGDWLLFSDADVHYAPFALQKAIQYCAREKLDFLTVVPAIHALGFLLQGFVTQFLQAAALAVDLERVANPERQDSVGGGAFNLVRKDVLARSRGLEWLKLDVIDDTGLAFIVKQAGAHCGVVGGIDEVELEWYPNLWSFVRGLEKNSFAIFQYSWIALILFICGTVGLIWGATLAPVQTQNLWILVFNVLCIAFYLWNAGKVLKKLAHFSPWILLLLPLTSLGLALIALRAACLFQWRGGVFWRGVFYARSDLIAQQRLKVVDLIFKRR